MANKVIRKISKKTTGKSVDNVADYIDLIAQIIVEYIDTRYKVKKKVEDIKKATVNTLYTLKKGFVQSIVEGIFLATGLIALILGIIILMSRYVPIEFILIVYGLIVTILVLLKIKVKA
ncbi:MAG: hypothetical protein PHV16_02915 [Candidatus Nanoarchaeia archaeon]|nr:hypothetical protein [Candidatus Nanoarchaeia archaeon]